MNLYFTFQSRDTLKTFALFITVQVITKLNLGHRSEFEIEFQKISRPSSRSLDNGELVISRCCFAEKVITHVHCLISYREGLGTSL